MSTEPHSSNDPRRSYLRATFPRWILFAVVASYLTQPIYQSQILFHEVVGRWIWFRKALPTTDLWSRSTLGMSWYSSSWLFDLVVYFVNRIGDVNGVAFLKLALHFCVLVSLYWSLFRIGRDAFFAAALAIVIACGSLVASPFNAHLLGLCCFSILMGLLSNSRSSSVSIPAVVATAVLYANVDSYAVVASVFLVGYVLLNTPIQNKASLCALLLGANVCTPYLAQNIKGVLSSSFHILHFDITTLSQLGGPYDYGTAVALLLTLLLFMFSRTEKMKLKASVVLLSIFALGLSFFDKNLASFACVFLGVQVAALWSAIDAHNNSNRKPLAEGVVRFQNKLSQLIGFSPEGVLWILCCLLFVNIVNLKRIPIYHSAFPVHEAKFLKEQKLPTPLLHPSSVGSYLIWSFADQWAEPQLLSWTDERVKEIQPDLAIAEYRVSEYHALEKTEDVAGYVNSSGAKSALFRVRSPVYEYLKAQPDWKLIFENGAPIGAEKDDVENPTTSLSWAVFVKNPSS